MQRSWGILISLIKQRKTLVARLKEEAMVEVRSENWAGVRLCGALEG